MLDNAITIKPRRQMSVQFSGGEPTLVAVLPGRRPLRPQGRIQLACRPRPTESNSPRASSSAQQAAEAGMRYAYLQFDGIGNAANAHRKVGNLFDVKLKAIENLHKAGVRDRSGRHHRQRHQQRAGRTHHQVRARQSQDDRLPVVPAGIVHRPRRSRHRRSPRKRSATRCPTWRTT